MLLPISVQAQSIGVGHSVKFWGQAKNMIEVSISHNDFGLHYFHSFDDSQRYFKGKIPMGKKIDSFALSWAPLKYKFIYSGVMVSNKKYPVEKGSYINFVVGIEIPVKRFTISYKHTSNGFGIQNEINVGVDFISLSYRR